MHCCYISQISCIVYTVLSSLFLFFFACSPDWIVLNCFESLEALNFYYSWLAFTGVKKVSALPIVMLRSWRWRWWWWCVCVCSYTFKRSQQWQQQQQKAHIIRLSYRGNLCLLHIIIHLLVPINFQVLFFILLLLALYFKLIHTHHTHSRAYRVIGTVMYIYSSMFTFCECAYVYLKNSENKAKHRHVHIEFEWTTKCNAQKFRRFDTAFMYKCKSNAWKTLLVVRFFYLVLSRARR